MRLKLLIGFTYCYDYPKEVFAAFAVEGQVSRHDEHYLWLFVHLLTKISITMKA